LSLQNFIIHKPICEFFRRSPPNPKIFPVNPGRWIDLKFEISLKIFPPFLTFLGKREREDLLTGLFNSTIKRYLRINKKEEESYKTGKLVNLGYMISTSDPTCLK
jgi:hypothetical protein